MCGRMGYHGRVIAPEDLPQPAPRSPKRRRCICGCRRLFKPVKPWQKFYEDQCRKQYHRYGPSFGPLKREGLRRLLKEARAEIRGEYRELLDLAIEDAMQRSGWSDARTRSLDLAPLALKGAIDILGNLLRELRRDYVQLETRVKILESGERRKLAELETRMRALERTTPSGDARAALPARV